MDSPKRDPVVTFEVVGELEHVETIAAGPSVKVRSCLQKKSGRGRWRKRKGIGTVRLPHGNLRRVERHRYEARGIGKRELKIKNGAVPQERRGSLLPGGGRLGFFQEERRIVRDKRQSPAASLTLVKVRIYGRAARIPLATGA